MCNNIYVLSNIYAWVYLWFVQINWQHQRAQGLFYLHLCAPSAFQVSLPLCDANTVSFCAFSFFLVFFLYTPFALDTAALGSLGSMEETVDIGNTWMRWDRCASTKVGETHGSRTLTSHSKMKHIVIGNWIKKYLKRLGTTIILF